MLEVLLLGSIFASPVVTSGGLTLDALMDIRHPSSPAVERFFDVT